MVESRAGVARRSSMHLVATSMVGCGCFDGRDGTQPVAVRMGVLWSLGTDRYSRHSSWSACSSTHHEGQVRAANSEWQTSRGSQGASPLTSVRRPQQRFQEAHLPRYWVIAPFDVRQPEYWERIWASDLGNNVISIGWAEVGDVLGLDRDGLRAAVDAAYPADPPAVRGLFTRMLWDFCHEIGPGDIVIARRGTRRIAAIGVVTRSAYYDTEHDQTLFPPGHGGHPFHIGVEWRPEPRDQPVPGPPLAIHTLYETAAETLDRLTCGTTTATTDPPAAPSDSEFILERYLEDFIVSNFDSIFRGRLELYSDGNHNVVGQQFPTDVGPIDILAHDPTDNALVVIELKKGREADRVVGQILRYMGWVSEHLAEPGQPVQGIIVCQEQDERLRYATRMVPSISVRCYRIQFTLTDP